MINGRRVVTISPQEAREAREKVEVRPSLYGKGLFARRRLKAYTFVGTYPGVIARAPEFEKLAKNTQLGTYAVSFFKLLANGTLDEDWVINPGNAAGTLLPQFSNAVTPFANEPTNGPANLIWVWNFAKGTVEMYTAWDVKPGQELTICYGKGYRRGYTSSCAAGHNHGLHYKFADTGRPRAFMTRRQRDQEVARFVRNASPSPPGTPANSLNRARSPSPSANTASVNSTRARSPSINTTNRVLRKRSRNNTGPSTPPPKRGRAIMGRNAWLRDMRALLDKPRLGAPDILAIHALREMYPYITNNSKT